MNLNSLKKYNKKDSYSYTLGVFPTVELLTRQPDSVEMIVFHPDWYGDTQKRLIESLAEKSHIPLWESAKTIDRIRDKENIFVAGVFRKYDSTLNPSRSHVVLVNPGDMGNFGTILRTCLGFSFTDLAIISPGVDAFHPKSVRASMGALFSANVEYFSSFEQYRSRFSERDFYPFMLKGAIPLKEVKRDSRRLFSLIFGNESSGLDDSYLEMGTSVFIPHSTAIDSLNLSMAVGIGVYEFSERGA